MSTSVSSESCFVAVIVGTSIAAFGPIGRWEETDAEAELELLAGSGLLLLLGALGCDFDSQPALLDSTETENTIPVATRATTAINSVADLLVKVGELKLRRVRRINPGRFSSRGIGNSFWLSLTNSFLGI